MYTYTKTRKSATYRPANLPLLFMGQSRGVQSTYLRKFSEYLLANILPLAQSCAARLTGFIGGLCHYVERI